MEINIRNAQYTDLNFITSNWLKQYRGSIFARNMGKDIYFRNYNVIVNHVLRKSINIMASDPKDPYVCWGFIVMEKPNIIHYMFTKNHFRGHGIGKKLFEKAIKVLGTRDLVYTHLPKYKKYPEEYKWEYNPFYFLNIEVAKKAKENSHESKSSKVRSGSKAEREDVVEFEHGGQVTP